MDKTPPKNIILFDKVKKMLRKRNIALLSIFLFVPFVAIIDMLFNSDKATLSFAIATFIIIGWQIVALIFYKCPRCQKLFFWSQVWANVFTNKCMNCGLGIEKRKLIS
jgi:hypothetical protein